MRKSYAGVRLKALREARKMTQASLAQLLDLSTSYLNQIENNQRPLSVQVLLRLQAALGVDLQYFSEDESTRLIAQMQEVVNDTGEHLSLAELQALAEQMPGVGKLLVRLHRRAHDSLDRLQAIGAQISEREPASASASARQAHEEVRDFFYEASNHMPELDLKAEALHEELFPERVSINQLTLGLERRLHQAHGIATREMPDDAREHVRFFDERQAVLWLSPGLEPGQRAFQIATQLAILEAGTTMDALTKSQDLVQAESRALARIGLASYFAGALVLPYTRFLDAAEAAHYDIDALALRFGVSFETVCHRLSTLQRQNARGVPFFFVRVDRAGNISKRQSATDFHFSRTGGTCPLWNVYEAFAQPGKLLTQLANLPDGRTYLWIARAVVRPPVAHGAPSRTFAIGLGCDLRHASKLVYAKGLDLRNPTAATPIGPGCLVCERKACEQRAFPALGRRLKIDERIRLFEPYASA